MANFESGRSWAARRGVGPSLERRRKTGPLIRDSVIFSSLFNELIVDIF